MTTTTAEPAPADPAVPRVLALEVADAPSALTRVLVVLQRRRCRVTRVEFAASQDARDPGRLLLGIDAPPRHAHCVEAWLSALVDVLAVEPLAGDGAPA